MRALSAQFMNDLVEPAGLLHSILTQVKKDQTLMLAIRDGYINIYYRGGNILNVKEHNTGSYKTFFDEHYDRSGQRIVDSHTAITTRDDAQKMVALLSARKNIMDEYFSMYGKTEREFQQLVARENNYSTISNESEYFISDIEASEPGAGARFDILAIRWLASQRQRGSNCRVALVEMKYGDKALGGSSGLLKHLKDMDALVTDEKRYASLVQTIENQFDQLDQLGLLNFNRGKNLSKIHLDATEKPEVVFILANHNPRSSNLKTILNDPEIDAYGQSSRFDLRFFVASFAGYALHAGCMLPLAEFRKLL